MSTVTKESGALRASPASPAVSSVFEPWPRQREAITCAVSALRHDGRVSIVAACGTGKTAIGLGTAEALDAGRVLVVVPTSGLLEQTMAVHAARPDTRCLGRIVAVCSEPSPTFAGCRLTKAVRW